jgi:hypothetical protein
MTIRLPGAVAKLSGDLGIDLVHDALPAAGTPGARIQSFWPHLSAPPAHSWPTLSLPPCNPHPWTSGLSRIILYGRRALTPV